MKQMLEKYEREVKIIETHPGFVLTVSKRYRKIVDFKLETYIPVTFNFSVDSHITLSFKIFAENRVYSIQNGEWENDKYRGYFIILKNGYAELNTIVTPENFRNIGFATAILDITFELISFYNEIINQNIFPEIQEYRKIEYIKGFISSCDIGNRLSDKQLEEFYHKNGFTIEKNKEIYHYFI